MKSKLFIGAVALIALAVFGIALLQRAPSQTVVVSAMTAGKEGTAATTSQDTSGASSSSARSYTLADVAAHSSGTSCWVAINGNVYDLTNWINQHPGGPERILNICGTDATAAFNAQHGGQGRPAQELAQFYIAPLSQ